MSVTAMSEEDIFVRSVSATGTDGITVCFELCNGGGTTVEKYTLSSEVYASLDIRKGQCTRELYETVVYESGICSAQKRGMYILGFGGCSRRMLVSKLCVKGFDRGTAAEAVARIASRGFIDDEKSSKREAQRCASKLWGRERIKAYLASRGYDRQDAERAVFALEDDGTEFVKNCKELIIKKFGIDKPDGKETARIISFACKYGYSTSEAREALSLLSSERQRLKLYR